MPRPLSNDLRERIIEAKQRGDTESEIAEEKEVSKSTVTKLWALFRETGSYEARPNPNGRKPALTEAQLEQIRERIKVQSDITLKELVEELGLPVSISALCRTIKGKLGYRFKKKALRADEQNREDVKVKRDEWNASQPEMESAKLVFLDESSVNTAATRLYGRGLNGERVNDHVPEANIESTTILSSVRLNGEIVPLVFEGALDGDMFKATSENPRGVLQTSKTCVKRLKKEYNEF